MKNDSGLGKRLGLYLGGVVLALTLGSCGGGGSPAVVAGGFPASSTLVNLCATPRTGTDPFNQNQLYPDRQGTLSNEKSWLRSWIDETYLWYQEVPTNLNAAAYPTAIDYFNVLKTPALTATNQPKDKFHFTYPTDTWNALNQQGVELGYGIQFAALSKNIPRRWVVATVEANSPAAVAGVLRGDELLSVDGVDFVYGSTQAAVDTLNAGLFPLVAGQNHQMIFVRNALQLPAVNMLSSNVTTTPVQNVKSIATATGNVGYLTFNSHNAVSEAQLIAAINQLKTLNINDLVLDLRYNGGGLLDVANELAYMIAGPQATTGKVFEYLQFNGKFANMTFPFHTVSMGFSGPSNVALPFLGLTKVTILTSAGTCSASESIINSLRGVNVVVNLIGDTTCGKPYGFYPAPNCGTTYFAIQFQGVNDKNFGNYADGFAPTCRVADDFTRPLGDPLERQLAEALNYRNTGICSPPAALAGGLKAGGGMGNVQLIRSPLKEMRILSKPVL